MGQTTLQAGTQDFEFHHSAGGREEFWKDGERLSAKRTVFGGKHRFQWDGDDYEVKVKPSFWGPGFKTKVNGGGEQAQMPEKDMAALALCGWPMLLVFIGGALGGLMGGAATAANFSVYNAEMGRPAKVVLNLAIGAAAIAVWFAGATAVNNTLTG
ncbi:MAG TPA: hypothetical protein VKA14_06870 [Gammaproteobacteria bacterium]|nr:hypothetical protein [Gammaproteobacteria bacterium]